MQLVGRGSSVLWLSSSCFSTLFEFLDVAHEATAGHRSQDTGLECPGPVNQPDALSLSSAPQPGWEVVDSNDYGFSAPGGAAPPPLPPGGEVDSLGRTYPTSTTTTDRSGTRPSLMWVPSVVVSRPHALQTGAHTAALCDKAGRHVFHRWKHVIVWRSSWLEGMGTYPEPIRL